MAEGAPMQVVMRAVSESLAGTLTGAEALALLVPGTQLWLDAAREVILAEGDQLLDLARGLVEDPGADTPAATPQRPAVAPERPAGRLRPAEPALLLHTSGTTGRPKLVPLTHQQLITAAVFMNLEVPEAAPGARHLSALPLFHVAGQANLCYVLLTGGHLHVLGGFDPVGFVDELASRRIQLTQLVPTLIHAVTQEVSSRAERPDLSHLVEIVYGASPIRPDLLERAVAVLGCRFRQNYASSETGPLPISSLAPDDHDPARGRLGTAGRPSLGWELRLGESGEIQVRGAAPLPGYWNDPDATSRSLTAHPPVAGGYWADQRFDRPGSPAASPRHRPLPGSYSSRSNRSMSSPSRMSEYGLGPLPRTWPWLCTSSGGTSVTTSPRRRARSSARLISARPPGWRTTFQRWCVSTPRTGAIATQHPWEWV